MHTVTRMPAKSAGKTRLSDSGLVRQAAIPVRVGISNGRHRHESSAHQSTFRHRPIRLPRRPAVGHFALVTYHNRLLHQTRIFPLPRPPLSTTIHVSSPPPSYRAPSRSVSRSPRLETRTERERCWHACSTNEKFRIFFSLPSNKSTRNLNFFRFSFAS